MPQSSTPQPEAALQTPVLLLVFNRPDTTRRVFETIRQARPTRLYVAADGPRANRPTDVDQCAATRAVVQEVDWPCEVFTLFQERNLNCGIAPITAINWFFSHETEGIILEDDCVPAPSFFSFCQELLARYRDDTRVMHIGGNNFGSEAQEPLTPGAPSYYFSTQRNSWGWATWRRAWVLYDYNLTGFQEAVKTGALDGMFTSPLEKRYRLSKMAAVLRLPQPADVWDYQWEYTIGMNSGLYIVPAVNLVGNIGFGNNSTHTHDDGDMMGAVPARDLAFPLVHPAYVRQDRQRDRKRFNEFLRSRVSAIMRRLFAGQKPVASNLQSPTTKPKATAEQPSPVLR
ncbi:nucleotide-diphospho-sugar transferase [Hymenobacter sp. GOD-10R]|uniref:nucleotide-diphospho-sugar transferase n=1 Tax=Hymenobacter sp. GOD-10R TaxID=3093922 RepID=UPI002D78D7E4|nr:nucleotide-diphospho-sugar transferase [Hymenobacter sp. GOD-10R]WRQ28798.1 nucleotide-diphospho-sugar transferase [Hymenobacter sp. GOD-10R]